VEESKEFQYLKRETRRKNIPHDWKKENLKTASKTQVEKEPCMSQDVGGSSDNDRARRRNVPSSDS